MTTTTDTSAIEAILNAQTDAWNRGDLDGYLDYFWRDPRLYYASRNTVVRGWEALRESYARRYGEGAQLGHVQFSDVEIEILAEDAAKVTGRFEVTQAAYPASGTYLIVLRKFAEAGWKVVSDQVTPESAA